MKKTRNEPGNVDYGVYLGLDHLLDLQKPESDVAGRIPAHDEMLFIITHQAYELWFKQILHEMNSVCVAMSTERLDDRQLGTMIHRLSRVHAIQDLLLKQIDVIETMTPLDFLDFRDLLVPASGFQSVQFKLIEICLGLRSGDRTSQDLDFFRTRLSPANRALLSEAESKPSLFDLTNRWLERMPFDQYGEFDFWKLYAEAVDRMLASDNVIVEMNPAISDERRKQQLQTQEQVKDQFTAILDRRRFEELRAAGSFRMTHDAFLGALFINLYRDEPILYAPFQFLQQLADIDEAMSQWRTRHAMMVHRMLGSRIGTGGSSGHDYLLKNAQANRVWTDLYNISTFLIPRRELPALPDEIRRDLGFHFG